MKIVIVTASVRTVCRSARPMSSARIEGTLFEAVASRARMLARIARRTAMAPPPMAQNTALYP